MNAEPDQVHSLLQRLVGLVVTSVLVGPAGLSIAMCRPGVTPVGLECDASIWIEGAIRVRSPTQLLFESTNYPGRECEPLLRQLLLNKSVSACALSAKGNRLRVVLGEDILLLGCPFEDGGESFPCMVYVRGGELTKYIVVHPQEVEYLEEVRRTGPMLDS
jgi:hypothetical protein